MREPGIQSAERPYSPANPGDAPGKGYERGGNCGVLPDDLAQHLAPPRPAPKSRPRRFAEGRAVCLVFDQHKCDGRPPEMDAAVHAKTLTQTKAPCLPNDSRSSTGSSS